MYIRLSLHIYIYTHILTGIHTDGQTYRQTYIHEENGTVPDLGFETAPLEPRSGSILLRMQRDVGQRVEPQRVSPRIRGPQDHINIRISHSGSKAQSKGDARKHVL